MPAVPLIGLGLAAVGTGYSIYAGERANKQAKKAAKLEGQRNDLQAARQKRDAVRQARMAYATSQAAAENQGVSASSSAAGGQSSIASQIGSELSFLDQYGFLSDQASKALGKSQSWSRSAQMGEAVAGVGLSVFSNASEISQAIGKVFNSGPPKSS
jgi:hypothetical protein